MLWPYGRVANSGTFGMTAAMFEVPRTLLHVSVLSHLTFLGVTHAFVLFRSRAGHYFQWPSPWSQWYHYHRSLPYPDVLPVLRVALQPDAEWGHACQARRPRYQWASYWRRPVLCYASQFIIRKTLPSSLQRRSGSGSRCDFYSTDTFAVNTGLGYLENG